MKAIDFRYDILPLKDKLFRLVLRITLSRAEAEDITQDVLLRTWERRDTLTNVQNIEAYVLTTGRNLALDRLRSRDTQTLSFDESQTDAPDTSPTPQERLEQDERLSRVAKIFNDLPEAQRTILQLRDIEGKTTAETAEIMGITEENAKVTLFRARQALRKRFQKNEQNGL